MKLNPYHSPTQNGLDLHVRPETTKPLEENREMLQDVGMGISFLDKTSKVQETKANVEKWQLKRFCPENKTINRL